MCILRIPKYLKTNLAKTANNGLIFVLPGNYNPPLCIISFDLHVKSPEFAVDVNKYKTEFEMIKNNNKSTKNYEN